MFPDPDRLASTDPPVSMDLPTLDISYKWNYVMCVLSSLALFPWRHVFRVHPHCSVG